MFNMMFKPHLILTFIVFLSACAGSKKAVSETKQKVETITEITEKKLDTIIFIPAEKVSVKIPFKEFKTAPFTFLKPKIVTNTSGKAKVTVKIDSTGIEATSNCDSISKRLLYYKKVFKEFKKETNDRSSKVKEKKGYSLLELLLYMLVTAVVSFGAAYLLKTFKLL